jgi:hypothetical protein
MTNLKFGLICALLMAGGVMLLVRQHSAQVKLRADNFALQQEAGQLTSLAEENARLSNRIARAQNLPPSSTNPLTELSRLRAEVGAQKSEIEKLRTELADELAKPSFQNLPGSNRFVNLPKESWAFAGYATPEAAFQSMLWATLQGDVNSIRASITPAEQERRLAGEWKDKTDSEIADAGVQGLSKATGIQILNLQMFSPDEAHFTVYISGIDHPDQPLWMDVKRIGGEWKVAASEHHRDGH